MSTETMREEFELWWYDHKQKELRQSCAIGWGLVIWQASRAAIEVELPKSANSNSAEVIKAVGRHIIAQGLKVKP